MDQKGLGQEAVGQRKQAPPPNMHAPPPQQNPQTSLPRTRFARKLHLRLKNYQQQTSDVTTATTTLTSSEQHNVDDVTKKAETHVTANDVTTKLSNDVAATANDVTTCCTSSASSDSDVYYDFDMAEEEHVVCVINKSDGLDEGIPTSPEQSDYAPLITNGYAPSPPESPAPNSTISALLPPSDFKITRSSSLKTGKTPPNTPARKKIVRFADVLGLDLTDVRTFLDEIPNVPRSAFSDLDSAISAAINQQQRPPTKQLLANFHQPFSQPDFFDKIRENCVCLENAYQSEGMNISGTVRVKNMDFHKSVYVRYTLNDWRSWTDFQATYSPGSCDGFSDKFDFTMTLPTLEIGTRLQFAVRFHCSGEQYWDSNGGSNYSFVCVAGGQQGWGGWGSYGGNEWGGGWM